MFLLAFIVRRKALPFRCIVAAKSSKISSNYKDRKNSDTFLPAPVKLAITSVFYAILRHPAQPPPETSAAEERRPGICFRSRSFLPDALSAALFRSSIDIHLPEKLIITKREDKGK